MFDNPFDFAAIVIAIVAFIFARKAINQTAALRTQLDLVQKLAADRPVPPPITQVQAAERTITPASPGIAPAPPPIIPQIDSVTPAAAADVPKAAIENTTPAP